MDAYEMVCSANAKLTADVGRLQIELTRALDDLAQARQELAAPWERAEIAETRLATVGREVGPLLGRLADVAQEAYLEMLPDDGASPQAERLGQDEDAARAWAARLRGEG